jgi:hypothetical protein
VIYRFDFLIYAILTVVVSEHTSLPFCESNVLIESLFCQRLILSGSAGVCVYVYLSSNYRLCCSILNSNNHRRVRIIDTVVNECEGTRLYVRICIER